MLKTIYKSLFLTFIAIITITSINIHTAEASSIGHISVKKKNIKFNEEWSSKRRISDNLKTGNSTGTITANKVTKFSTTVSGGIGKGNIGFSKSVSNARSYSMKVPKNSNKYLSYKARYKVEKGNICQKFSGITNKCISGWKAYTVKRPLHGQYELLNAK